MASLAPPITPAKTGDLVVPISQIVELLKSKLAQADIDALLSALLAGTGPQQVRSGDLITADLVNWVLAQLSDLQGRVAFLEGSLGKSGDVVITGLDPADGNVKVGGTLKVMGRNFQYSQGLTRAYVDGFQAGFQSGTSDQLLVLTVPTQLTNVPAAGRPGILTVSNGQSSAQAVLFVNPGMALNGFFEVNEVDSKPSGATPKGGQPFTLVFQLVSHVNLDTDVQLSATVTGPANAGDWQPIRLLNEDETVIQNGTLSLKQGASAKVLVRIDPIPAGTPDGVAFSLVPQVTAGTITQNKPVGLTTGVAYVAPDPGILLNFASGEIRPAVGGKGSTSASLIQVGSGSSARLVFNAQFDKPASYPLNLTVPSGWKSQLDQTANPVVVAASDIQPGGMATKLVSFFLWPDASPASSGQLTVQLTRPAATTGRTVSIPVQLQTP